MEADILLQRYPLRVLVVEDNRDLAKLFCDLLEVMGCVAEAVFNARSALENAKAKVPDLVFCDLRLPGGKNGFELAAELRADPALAHIPLIAVTGYADGDERERALEAGDTDEGKAEQVEKARKPNPPKQ